MKLKTNKPSLESEEAMLDSALEPIVLDSPETVTKLVDSEIATDAVSAPAESVNTVTDNVDETVSEEKVEEVVDAPEVAIGEAVGAVTAMEALISHYSTLDQTKSQSNETIVVCNILTDKVYKDLNISKPQSLSLEEGSTAASILATLRENAIKLIRAIAVMFKNAMENIKKYVKLMASSAARAEIKAKDLLTKANSLTGEPTATEYESPSLVNSIGGEYPLLRMVENTYSLIEDSEKSIKGEHISIISKAINTPTNAGGAGYDSEALSEQITKAIESAYSGMFTNSVSAEEHFGSVDRGCEYVSTLPLLGNNIAVLRIPETTTDLDLFSFKIYQDKKPEDKSISVSSKEDIKVILKTVIKMMAIVRHSEREVQSTTSVVDRLNQMINNVKNSDGADLKETTKILQALKKFMPFLSQGVHVKSFAFGIRSANALNVHAAKSISFYSRG